MNLRALQVIPVSSIKEILYMPLTYNGSIILYEVSSDVNLSCLWGGGKFYLLPPPLLTIDIVTNIIFVMFFFFIISMKYTVVYYIL